MGVPKSNLLRRTTVVVHSFLLMLLFALPSQGRTFGSQELPPGPMADRLMHGPLPGPPDAATADRVKAGKELLRRSVALRKKSIGTVFLGAHGEIVPLDGMRINGEPLFYVIPEDGTLKLIRSWSNQDEPYATVTADGNIVRGQTAESGEDTRAAPEKWKYRDKDGAFTMPPEGAALYTKQGKGKSSPTPPPNCVAWLFLTKGGNLVKFPDEVKPFQNVIWVVRKDDGGLDFVHSGPLETGTFMSIDKNSNVSYPAHTDQSHPGTVWPVQTEDHQPMLPEFKTYVIPKGICSMIKTTVLKNGMRTYAGPNPIP